MIQNSEERYFYSNCLNLWRDADHGIPEIEDGRRKLSQLKMNYGEISMLSLYFFLKSPLKSPQRAIDP
jgi:hypothetical protein